MQTFTLNIDIILGPLGAVEAAEAEALLNGLQINVGGTVIVIIIIIIIPGGPSLPPWKERDALFGLRCRRLTRHTHKLCFSAGYQLDVHRSVQAFMFQSEAARNIGQFNAAQRLTPLYPLSTYIAAVTQHRRPFRLLTSDAGAVETNTVPTIIPQPPNVPPLPPSTNITVPVKTPPPGTGSNIPSQNVSGNSTVTSPGAALSCCVRF